MDCCFCFNFQLLFDFFLPRTDTDTPTKPFFFDIHIFDPIFLVIEDEATLTKQRDNPRTGPIVEPQLVQHARKCVAENNVILSEDGLGGTYFVCDESGNKIAVFKPIDEEQGAPNCPKKREGEPHLPPGGGAIREIAAYLLDRPSDYGVPETHMLTNVFLSKDDGALPKSGSLQKFVNNIGSASSMGSSRFLAEDVHNIGILDIRILNLDRNGDNMMVVQDGNEKYRLIPIDHGFCLPASKYLGGAWFDWMYWRQAKAPFSMETRDYISSINIEADANILRTLGFLEDNIRTMKIMTTFLKQCVAIGLTLFDMAAMICRRISTEESDLEKLVRQAECLGGNFDEDLHRMLDEELRSKVKTRTRSTTI